MGLQDHARKIADDATKRAVTASRRARGVGGTTARKTATTGSEAGGAVLRTVRETVESVRASVDEIDRDRVGIDFDRVGTIPERSPVVAATRPTTLAVEIRQFLNEIDHRYAAKSGFNGARQGYAAGPYGAVLGAGAGTVYGAYNSTRATFDPETSTPNEGVEVGRYLDSIGHARTGYEVGKRFGTKGKVAGAAVGAGVSVLPLVAERIDEPLSRYVDSIPVPTIDEISVRGR